MATDKSKKVEELLNFLLEKALKAASAEGFTHPIGVQAYDEFLREGADTIRQELAALRAEVGAATTKAETEKKLRVDYQTVVYDLCNIADRFAGRHTSKGNNCTISSVTADIERQLSQRESPPPEQPQEDRCPLCNDLITRTEAMVECKACGVRSVVEQPQGEIAALKAALDKELDEHHKTQNEYYALKAKFIKLRSKEILRMQSCQRIGETEQPQAEPDGETYYCAWHSERGFAIKTLEVSEGWSWQVFTRSQVLPSQMDQGPVDVLKENGWRVVPVKLLKMEG